MRAAIYNPYLDTLGGGERYTMAFAQVLTSKGYKVDVAWRDKRIKEKLERRFGIKLFGVNFVKDIKRGDGYDICFWLSDGSIPLLRARKNFLHFQIPFKNVWGKSLLNKMKLFRINKIICNSYFTKNFIDQEYGVKSIVIYPPVDVKKFFSQKKVNIIIFVGRFSQLAQAKNQHFLVEEFKKLYDSGLKGWELLLSGGTEVGADEYVERLIRHAKGYPVKIIKNPNFIQLKNIYAKAKIFWSAVGFGADEKKEPKKVEHFGISVVEAMASSCVPVVFATGGYKEIITNGQTGFLWEKKSQLIKITKKLAEDPKLLKDISHAAKKASYVYEFERFESEINDII